MKIKFNLNTNVDKNHSSLSEDILKTHLDSFKKTISHEDYGFFNLTDDNKHISSAKEIFSKHSDKKYFVQVGIGGSALGPQMLIDSLGKSDVKFVFFDNTDADYIDDQIKSINPLESLFYIVSKSGGTAETMASFAILRSVLTKAGVHENKFNEHFVFCTDSNKGDLRELANENNYDTLEVPPNVGGRFSVLTSVGLLPALFAGLDVDALYKGANELKEELLSENLSQNKLINTAAHLNFLHTQSSPSINQTVMMPYSSKLKTFSHWFVQLWGESLGKYSETHQKNVGLTPIPAYGATDQHSQMQLFMEGENDKCLFLIEVKKKDIDFKLDNSIGKASSSKLNGYSLNQLLEAQLHGTLKALADRERPVIHIEIDKNDEEHLGALILFFESLTVVMAQFLEVNPFNQPGVELGKVYAYEYLAKL